MSKPTKRELQLAVNAAEFLRENGKDSRYLAKSLLYLEHRVEMLEKVFELTERYLHAGHDEHVHARLVRAIHTARNDEAREKNEPLKVLGL